jgi:hypothetical protein
MADRADRKTGTDIDLDSLKDVRRATPVTDSEELPAVCVQADCQKSVIMELNGDVYCQDHGNSVFVALRAENKEVSLNALVKASMTSEGVFRV